MIDINQVYTTVQAILNKEQRGYLGTMEFNLFAEQAQLEIFEGYFYDKSHFLTSRKGQDGVQVENLDEKMDLFMVYSGYDGTSPAYSSGRFTLPDNLYRLEDVYYDDDDGTRKIVSKIDHKSSRYVLNSSKTAPSTTFPRYERYGNTLQVFPDTIQSSISIDYYRKPVTPVWAAFPHSDGLVNPTASTDFELHPSEQYVLVTKILLLAGVMIREVDVVQYATQEESGDNANKKS